VELTDAKDFLRIFRRTIAYQKLAAAARNAGQPSPDLPLTAWFGALLELAHGLAAEAADSLREVALDGVRAGGDLVVASARCALGPPAARPLPRPVAKIDKLLHPASLGIVGVSGTGMNFGRIILRNLVGSGYPKERITIVKPGEAEIDGVR